jgi:hypothetical protein
VTAPGSQKIQPTVVCTERELRRATACQSIAAPYETAEQIGGGLDAKRVPAVKRQALGVAVPVPAPSAAPPEVAMAPPRAEVVL